MNRAQTTIESPTRFSESRFFRFGRLSKASRKSSSGYSNHSFSHQLDDDDYTSDIYQQLNHRSASMSTLPSNMPPASYTPVPYSDKTSSVVGMSQPRLSQLQTLEAKMASIAVSLSGGGRRSAAPTPLTNGSQQQQPAAPSAAPRSHSTTLDMFKSKTSSGQRVPKQIRSEIELLRKIILDKDALIHKLQQQQQQQQQQGNMTTLMQQISNNSRSVTNSNEKQQMERRLSLLHREIEMKKAAIKNIRISLQHTDVSDNIDSRIRQAETEYQLEREETNLLNLHEEKRCLVLRLSSNGANDLGGNVAPNQQDASLFRILQGQVPLAVVVCTVHYDAHSPCFSLQYAAQVRNDNSTLSALETCVVQWARDDTPLKAGDRLLEINGCLVPKRDKTHVIKLLQSGPIDLVVVRKSEEESLRSQFHELTARAEKLNKERDALKNDNLRLSHRISYLEEMQNESDKTPETQGQETSNAESDSVYRSEIRVQTIPVRQKPPRTSKIKGSSAAVVVNGNATINGHGQRVNGSENDSLPVVADYKRLHSSLDTRRAVSSSEANLDTNPINDANVSRIKTSSIVDRHFGHVIRVTHHHHPHEHGRRSSRPMNDSVSDIQSVASLDSYPKDRTAKHSDTLSGVSVSADRHFERTPPSPTESEVRSVASMDLDRRHLSAGYISDDLTIPRSYNGTNVTKKPKPVPPRKPSFLYLNRATSLQSVDGGSNILSLDRLKPSHSVVHDTNGGSQPKAQDPWPAGSKQSLKSTLAGNLKWNILSSSKTRSGGGNRDRDVEY